MPKFDEKSLVEDYFYKELQANGWTPILSDNLERESLEEPLLVANLIRAIKRLNTDLPISDEELRQALTELKLGKAEQVLHFLKNGIPIKFEKDRAVYNVQLIRYDDKATDDEFIVSRQIIHQSANRQIRNDLVLYVNGIPLVNIECKNPASLTETWHNAFTQMQDYSTTVPELYKYIQIGVASAETTRYFATTSWQQQEETKTHQWRTPDKPDPIDAAIEMLTPSILLDIIRNYLFFRIEHGTTTKVITRYMQYRAAQRIYNRAKDHLTGKDTKNKGLIWHWQGSGKTLTMIFAANKLFHDPILTNPTILFTVDREDLQEQLRNEYNALDITPKPEIVNSINALKQILTHDEGKGKRGIFISLMQKWKPEEFQQLQKDLEKLSQTEQTILSRKNVVNFVDEGHRSQYGALAAQMNLVLRNSSTFAFTGTPIAKKQRNTYDQFSYPPEEPYLDKYFIDASIQDGFTVPIAYQPRLEKDTHLPTDMLETFWKIELEEIPEEYREPVEQKVKDRLNKIKLFLENQTRITKVAKDIAEDFQENVEGKFKALVVAASRKACVTYKRELDKLLPPEYSEVVMTFNPQKDKPPIPEYYRELTKRFNDKEIDDIRKEIIEKYKEQQLPKILIVTDMLLTGFDAEILQTMYLDKPLKEHRLLQAVARTNRPYKNGLKEAGLILDYVGILRNLRKAFENYAQEDIKGILIPIEDLRVDFLKILNKTIDLFKEIPKEQYDRQTMIKAIEIITLSDQTSKTFEQNYAELRKLFQYLGTDPTKIEKYNDYKWLTAVYLFYRNYVNPPNATEQKYVDTYYNKTIKFVHSTTELEEIQRQLPTITFGENYLRELNEKLKTKQEKSANIVFTLHRFVLVERDRSPVHESLAERVDKLLKQWKERTKNYDAIIADGTEIVNQFNQLEQRRRQLKFDKLQYALLLTLEKQFPTNTTTLIQDTKQLTNVLRPFMFRDWQTQPTARKSVERETRTYLRKYIKQNNLTMEQFEQLYEKTIQNVKTYA